MVDDHPLKGPARKGTREFKNSTETISFPRFDRVFLYSFFTQSMNQFYYLKIDIFIQIFPSMTRTIIHMVSWNCWSKRNKFIFIILLRRILFLVILFTILLVSHAPRIIYILSMIDSGSWVRLLKEKRFWLRSWLKQRKNLRPRVQKTKRNALVTHIEGA